MTPEKTMPSLQTTPLDPVKILGLRVHRVNMSQALATIETFIAARKPHHVVTADASMVVLAREDEELARIVDRADLVTPDGAGILWASRLLKRPVTAKVSGVDLVNECCRLSGEKGYRLFILGAAPGIADAAAEKLREQHPGVNIVGTRHGYFSSDEEPEIVREITAHTPDVLFVAFGIPKQEKFITRHRDVLNVPVSIGVGGSFDVYSGQVQRAPVWMQNAGLEWAFRLSQNPKKIGKVLMLPRFALMALRARFLGK